MSEITAKSSSAHSLGKAEFSVDAGAAVESAEKSMTGRMGCRMVNSVM